MSKIEKKATGIMVALYLPQHIAQQIMVQDGEPAEDLHVTLTYHPGIGSDPKAFQELAEALIPVIGDFGAVEGRIGGVGRFNASENSDGKDVYYASFNSPVVSVLRNAVADAIESKTKYEVSRAHGFTPHVTLKYIGTQDQTPAERKASDSFKVPKLSLASREYRMDLPLTGTRILKDSPTSSSVHVPVPGEEKLKKDFDQSIQDESADYDVLKELTPDYDVTQRFVEGIDWESVENGLDETSAKAAASGNLEKDPDHYRTLFAERDGNANTLAKDMSGLRLDLGCGQCREPGYVGFDLYPHDAGTIVHDLTLGIPTDDDVAASVRLVNSLAYMEDIDVSALLGEVSRTLKVGGQFVYEGPDRLSDYPSQLELIDEANNADNLDESSNSPWYTQVFKRVEPDAATAQDSYPRLGQDQYGDLDTIVAGNALGYYWSDDTSSGQANRAYGYPSQGAASTLAEPPKEVGAYDVGKDGDVVLDEPTDQQEEGWDGDGNSFPDQGGTMPGYIGKKIGKEFPIIKADKDKQIVYGVVLTPDEVDAQEDYMTADDIEKAAHHFLIESRTVGSQHERPAQASVVESYIAPQDMEWDGQYGPQTVKKGAWVLGVKINDKKEWNKVLDGEYQAFSVGGFGVRE